MNIDRPAPTTRQLYRTIMTAPGTDDVVIVVTTARTVDGYESRAALVEADMLDDERGVTEVYETTGATTDEQAHRDHIALCTAWRPISCPYCSGVSHRGDYWECGACDDHGWAPAKQLLDLRAA